MVDDSQRQAAQGASLPPEQAAQGDSPSPDTSDDLGDLISDDAQALAQQAAQRDSPTPEPEGTVPEPPPAQNIYAELKRKLDKTIQQNEILQAQMQNMQMQRQQAPLPDNGNKPSFQPQQADFGEIIVKELQQKIAAGEIDGGNYYDVIRYQTKRMQELVQESTIKHTRVQSERQASEMRAVKKAKDMGYDITNRQDPMGALAWQEVARRATTVGMTAQEYYNAVPFAFEDAINAVSGSFPAKQAQPQGRELKQAQLPVSDISTARRKPVEKEPEPTEVDVALSKRYGSDFKTVNQIQKSVRNPKTFEVAVPIDLD